MKLEKINEQVKNALGCLGCEFVTAELPNGDIAVALLDVVDDWGMHLRDAEEGVSDLEDELGARDAECDEEVAILEKMGLEDSDACGWEETWRVVIIEKI